MPVAEKKTNTYSLLVSWLPCYMPLSIHLTKVQNVTFTQNVTFEEVRKSIDPFLK